MTTSATTTMTAISDQPISSIIGHPRTAVDATWIVQAGDLHGADGNQVLAVSSFFTVVVWSTVGERSKPVAERREVPDRV